MRTVKLQKAERVVLNFESAHKFAHAFCQVMEQGAVPVLLPNLQPGTLQHFADEYDSVLTDSDVASGLHPVSHLDFASYPDEQKIVFFTSGSSGTPKRIEKSWGQTVAEVDLIAETFKQQAQGAQLCTSVSHQHIYGFLFRVLWPLKAMMPYSEAKISYPEELLALPKAAMVLIASPAFLKRLEPIVVDDLDCRLVISSGGLLAKPVSQRVKQVLGVSPVEVLGSTETGAVASRTQDEGNPSSMWSTFPGVQVGANEEGLLVVNSPFCSSNPQLMGDRVELLADNQFTLLGRADRIVKIEEKRVSLTEIENLLAKHDLVDECHLLPFEDTRQQIVAVVVLNSVGQSKLESLGKLAVNRLLKSYLAPFYDGVVLPRKFRYVDGVPRNSQSKVEMSRLKELFSES